MFWQNNYAPSVQIDTLLNNENITLIELMDAEDILQECKNQNKKLIEFLIRSDVLEELVNLITEEPCVSLEERWRYKYSNVACELLTCDIPALTEKIAGNEMLLSKLYSFIDKDQPLNPLLASFFSKTLHALLRRTSDQNWFSHQFVCLQVLESLKSRKNCVDLLLQHIETSAIMDLIVILLTKVEGDEMRQNILNWLDDEKLVQKLVKILSSGQHSEKHSNVSQLLCAVTKSSRMQLDKHPDPILQTLQSEETIKSILDAITSEEKLETSIVGGLRVLINLVGQKESKDVQNNDTYGTLSYNFVENEQRDQFSLIIVAYLDKFNQLLLNPPKKPPVKTTAGFLEKPFGRTRLYVLKLYVSLLSTENFNIFLRFTESNTYHILLDLFFQYEWNNFLHTQVQYCISVSINCNDSKINETIYSNIFITSKLIEKILGVWEKNCIVIQQIHLKQGYIGHIIAIANEIVLGCGANNLLEFLQTNLPETTMEKWETFVKTKLDEINKKQQLSLGEAPENYLMSASGLSDEYSFPEESYGQDVYANSADSIYTESIYNFQAERSESVQSSFCNSLDQFNKSFPDDCCKSEELFDKICLEKEIDDLNQSSNWKLNEDTLMQKSDWLNEMENNSSSSDGDENDDNDNHIDDMNDPCASGFKVKIDGKDCSSSFNSGSESLDPWNPLNLHSAETLSNSLWKTEASESYQTGWANFDAFNNTFNTNENLADEMKTNKTDIKDGNTVLETTAIKDDELLQEIDCENFLPQNKTSKICEKKVFDVDPSKSDESVDFSFEKPV